MWGLLILDWVSLEVFLYYLGSLRAEATAAADISDSSSSDKPDEPEEPPLLSPARLLKTEEKKLVREY